MPPYAVLAALLVASCWGGNFAASKYALADMSPFLTILLRFMGLTLLLVPFALRQKLPPLRPMLIIAILLIVVQFALIFYSLAHGLSITSAIIATQMGVPFSCVVSAMLFKDYLGPWRSFGLMVAFMGVLIVAGTPNASAHWGAFLLAVVASLSWSCANLYMKKLPPQPVVTLLFWPGLFSLPFLAGLVFLFEPPVLPQIMAASTTAWLGIAYSAVFSSLVGYGLWNWLITRYPVSQVVPYSLCVPIVGITAGVVLFDEPLTIQILLGAALTIVGVTIITLRRPRLIELSEG